MLSTPNIAGCSAISVAWAISSLVSSHLHTLPYFLSDQDFQLKPAIYTSSQLFQKKLYNKK